jgi:protein CpxP
MTRTQKTIAGLTLATLTMLGVGGTAIALRAQEGGEGFGGPWPGRGMMGRRGGLFGELRMGLRALNLTDEQRAQVRTVLQGHRDDVRALVQKGRAARRQLFDAASGSPVDENAVRAASTAVADAAADAAILRAKVRSEIFALLTPEQREKAETLKQQMRERRRGSVDQ